MIPGILLLAAAALTVKSDQPLRAGCSPSDPVLATVRAGDRVQIKFALAGDAQACYLVTATVDGKPVDGNLPASALTGLEEFDRQRREARAVGGVQAAEQAPTVPLPAVRSSNPELQHVADLIRRNQPGEALEILQKLLKQNPKDPDLLAASGSAAYRGDNLRLALEYWGASLEARPDAALQRTYESARREASNDKSGEKKFGSRFLLRYDGTAASEDQARTMLSILDEEFARVSFELGCRAEERIVTIVQTRDAYLRSTGAPAWSGGGYDGKIRIPLADRTFAGGEIRRVFAHEIVHACLANIGTWPVWLHEGLAQKLSGGALSPNARQSLKAMAKVGAMPKLDQLGGSWVGKSTEGAAAAYTIALAAAECFYQFHSALGIRNLLNNPEALPRVAVDLDRRLSSGDW